MHKFHLYILKQTLPKPHPPYISLSLSLSPPPPKRKPTVCLSDGECSSFLCSINHILKQSRRSSKSFNLDGRMEVFTRQVKAAELMVENPGQFLCESTTLKVGNRIHGLTADEPLERRRLYFLLPMDLLYSVLTHEELSSLTYKASRALKNSRGFKNFSRIFPVFGDFRMFNLSESKRLDCDDYVIISVNSSHNSEPVISLEKYSKQRSWKPALETIDETPCTH